ncbi:MAG: Uma2 family endonuclease [Lachnospiraceae bacterium]|nr:Uma2 family endonuclease [Lachnospiraceae bacterium]
MTIEEMRRLKRERGLSISDISEYAGVPLGTLNKIFSGQTESPRRDTIRALEKFFSEDMPVYGKVNTDYYETKGELPSENMVCETAVSYGAPVRKQGEYTVDDIEMLDEYPLAELIDGVLYDLATPTLNHQRIAMLLYRQSMDFIDSRGGACEAFATAVGVHLEDFKKNYLIPDFFIVCDDEKKKEDGIYGAPDFVVEIISPSSDKKDTVIKRRKYMESGIREYWAIDLKRESVYVYLKDDPVGRIHPLEGKLGVNIYGGELEIDLDAISAILKKYPSKDDMKEG